VYKILTSTHLTLNENMPDYIKDLLKMYSAQISLRSLNQNIQRLPRPELNTYGFQFALPTLWNPLLGHLCFCSLYQSFKSSLKTRLFKISVVKTDSLIWALLNKLLNLYLKFNRIHSTLVIGVGSSAVKKNRECLTYFLYLSLYIVNNTNKKVFI
jgi:hypothetical protein